MPGATAYFGMIDVADPALGDTIVVSAAAGAVRSIAGQLTRIAGARVIGTAGSDRKCAWLIDDLGFDAAVNYCEADDLAPYEPRGATRYVREDGSYTNW